MLKPQWTKIVSAQKDNFESGPLRLFVNSGREKGRIGTVRTVSETSATLVFDDGKTAKVGFIRLESLDHEGNPQTVFMTDMLGDNIEPHAIVCYSQSSGGYGSSHALELGRVMKIGHTGTLMVRPLVRNSEKSQTPTRYNWQKKQHEEAPRKVDAKRCMKIPVDVTRLMMGLMTDFDNLGSDFNG